MFEPLDDPSYVARVEVDLEAGTISWPGGLDMAPEPLYDEARSEPDRRSLGDSLGRFRATHTTSSKEKNPRIGGDSKMGGTGLEPVTPSLSSWCSPN